MRRSKSSESARRKADLREANRPKAAKPDFKAKFTQEELLTEVKESY